MVVVIRSAPGDREAKRGVRLARDMAADIVLVQNGVYLACGDRLEGFCGTAHALEEDLRLRGVTDIEKGVRTLTYDDLVDLLAEEDKVVGMF
jgi:sulfur relay protein TusB/DsrH